MLALDRPPSAGADLNKLAWLPELLDGVSDKTRAALAKRVERAGTTSALRRGISKPSKTSPNKRKRRRRPKKRAKPFSFAVRVCSGYVVTFCGAS